MDTGLLSLIGYLVGVGVTAGAYLHRHKPKPTDAEHIFVAAFWPLWVPFWLLAHYVGRPIAWLISALPIALIACMPCHALAGNCGQFFYPQQVVAVAPVFAAPVYYQAGRDIEAEALAEKVARLAAPKIIERLKLAPGQVTLSAAEKSGASSSALAQNCAKCHSGAAPKANAVFDGSTPLRCEQVIAALKSIRDGSMPKDHQVSPEVKGQLMEELLALTAE
jgi:hypothetical protein